MIAPARRRFDAGLVCLVIVFMALLAALMSHTAWITSDGIDHYVYLRSLWVDRDLELGNDYRIVSPGHEAPEATTPLGRVGNPHPIGPALIWAPFFAIADAWTRLSGQPPDGWNRSYKMAVAIASLVYGWLGLVGLYRTAARLTDRGSALLATLGIAFATFLTFYLVYAPTMAHAAAFGAASLVVWLWLRPTPTGARRALALGAACGLAALVRWQAGLLFIVVLVDAWTRVRGGERRAAALRNLGLATLAAAVVFFPQMLVWRLLYGSWLTVPQGASFLAGTPAWGGVLFSPRHGLFSWSPFLYVGAVGAALWLRKQPLQAAAAILVFLLCTRLNAGTGDWWGGSAFGARRFDVVLPFFGLGVAFALAALGRLMARRPGLAAASIVGAAALWNLLLAAQYRSGAWDYAGPVAFEEMGRGAASAIDRLIGSPFSLPASLFERVRSGRAPADYESLYADRAFNRFSLRFGVDERMFLEDGWSVAASENGTTFRSIAAPSAGLIAPLHRGGPYVLGARVRGSGALRVVVNDRPVGVWELSEEWSQQELLVPSDRLRGGRNLVRFRLVEGSNEAPAAAVAGFWMEPRTTPLE